ncbi:monovalent cation/H(+) antiporter subunit G [Thermomicrobium sp. CFH 73360]|uniref:monovalent cation/H(+) antiporter subunit G n=1 Tax=Thermomicrobium sp. CFH 73360 TaxID=2951987 RepID=UPI0020778581|nr:monovalent cation/H(+) antiporter subunit G [Thermomicrobium sp. CFH 73360]MCM8746900.1 monovalent cation/H(+) antiporter subunit G [Thermomicrobium sp. CFH 73360]
MIALVTGLLAFSGALLMLIAAVGLLRMPDFYMRMQAAAKAGTLGILLIVAATGITLGSLSALLHAFLASLFFLLTTPIAAHLLGRAAYLSGIRPMVLEDELAGRYHPATHELRSNNAPAASTPGSDRIEETPA